MKREVIRKLRGLAISVVVPASMVMSSMQGAFIVTASDEATATPDSNIEGQSESTENGESGTAGESGTTDNGNTVQPPQDGTTPPAEGIPPTEGEVPPTGEVVPPTGEEVPPTEEEVPPTEEEVPPTEEEVPPAEEEVPPAEEEVPPTEEEVPPVEEVPPSEEEVPPTDDVIESPPSVEVPDYSDVFSDPVIDFRDYDLSKYLKDDREKVKYNAALPIEGIPSFITQEMIIGALKCQDETGFPASVTIAQIIQESGYGSYGEGGEDGQGLSYLAFQYCNLFGIKGTGSAGSVNMLTGEQTSAGDNYTITAGFRVYNTYTEAIEDRTELLKEVYSDLTEGVTDANTFAVQVGSRWATAIHYGQSLIKVMETYDLYRLDDMTVEQFSDMIGTFADPCPGAQISSTFGYRTFDSSFHKGLDLGTGTANIPTYAAEAGTVITAGWSDSAGNWIVIDHENGIVTKYMHHDKIYVEEGQKVEKGQQIGLSGTTGYSTGNHLHFQVEENGVAVDPLTYLTSDEEKE